MIIKLMESSIQTKLYYWQVSLKLWFFPKNLAIVLFPNVSEEKVLTNAFPLHQLAERALYTPEVKYARQA